MHVLGTTAHDFRAARELKPAPAEAPIPIEGALAGQDIQHRAELVAGVAATTAVHVDRDARFPNEAVAAARSQRLLGIMVPHDLGGEGASLSDVVDVCYMLGTVCGSSAMIFAMHQIQVACIVHHALGSAFFRDYARDIGIETDRPISMLARDVWKETARSTSLDNVIDVHIARLRESARAVL